MDKSRRRITTGWLVLGAVIVALNLGCLGASLCLRSIRVPEEWGGPMRRWTFPPTSGRYTLYDGSVYEYAFWLTPPQFTMIQPPTFWGLVRVWWPVAVGIGVSLALYAVGPERIWRLIRVVRGIRLTMLQCMILISAVAIWLFLFRINAIILTVGSLVVVLMVHSAFRRNTLAREIKLQGGHKHVPILSIVGAVGYSIAVIMAVVWVVLIAVADSYPQIH